MGSSICILPDRWETIPCLFVRQRLQLIVVFFLCVTATGAQWDLLQSFAWGRMMMGYARAMPLSQAVARTFDGEMCGLCRMVANAKKQEQPRSDFPSPKPETKIVFFFQPAPKVILAAPFSAAWRPAVSSALTEARPAPPVPPPRRAAA